jgi:hypothetical protein
MPLLFRCVRYLDRALPLDHPGSSLTQLGDQAFYPDHPIADPRNVGFYLQAVRTGKLMVTAALEECHDSAGIDRRIGSKLHLDIVGSGFYASNSQRCRCNP